MVGQERQKLCRWCGQAKPLSAFYKHAKMANGHLNKCAECCRSCSLKHRHENIDAVREYDRRRANLPHRIAMVKRVTAQYAEKFPERTKANNALTNAVRDGRVEKPKACWACGRIGRIVGHHFDYGLPLAVSWLCQPCHKETHKITDEVLSA